MRGSLSTAFVGHDPSTLLSSASRAFIPAFHAHRLSTAITRLPPFVQPEQSGRLGRLWGNSLLPQELRRCTRSPATLFMEHRGEGSSSSRSSRRRMMSQAVLSVATVLAFTDGPGQLRSAAAVSAGASSSPGVAAAGTVNAGPVAASTAAAEGQSGFVSGIAVSLVKQTVLYPVDTVKVRLQTTPLEPGRAVWTRAGLFRDTYRGFLLPLIFNAPAGGVFFAAKDAVKTSVSSLGNIPSTLISIFVASFPYWLVRQPSEVLKVRRQSLLASGSGGSAGAAVETGSIVAALKESAQLLDIRKPGTFESLSLGFGSNLAYTFPADAIKFVAYDYLKVEVKKKLGTKPNAFQAALLGSVASILAQAATTPLDVARNRIMKGSERGGASDYAQDTFVSAIVRIYKEEGAAALMLGFTPRVVRAIASGALQFSTYEFTKGKVGS